MPMIESSSGTFIPFSFATCRAANARISFDANTAVAGVSLLIKSKAEKMARTVDDISKKASFFSKWKGKSKGSEAESEEEE